MLPNAEYRVFLNLPAGIALLLEMATRLCNNNTKEKIFKNSPFDIKNNCLNFDDNPFIGKLADAICSDVFDGISCHIDLTALSAQTKNRLHSDDALKEKLKASLKDVIMNKLADVFNALKKEDRNQIALLLDFICNQPINLDAVKSFTNKNVYKFKDSKLEFWKRVLGIYE